MPTSWIRPDIVFFGETPSIYETHSAILRPVLSSRTVSSGLESGDPDGDRGVRIRDGELESVPSIALARTTDQVDIFDEVTASFIGLYVEGRPGPLADAPSPLVFVLVARQFSSVARLALMTESHCVH